MLKYELLRMTFQLFTKATDNVFCRENMKEVLCIVLQTLKVEAVVMLTSS